MEVGRDVVCATTSSSVKCWGYPHDNEKTGLHNPRNLVVGYNSDVCMITDDGVLCSGYNYTAPPANLGIPESISGSYDYMCALKGGKIACWGKDEYGRLKVPSELAM